MSDDLTMPPELRSRIDALAADLNGEAERLIDIARRSEGSPREIQAKILAAALMVTVTSLGVLNATRPVPPETIALAMLRPASRQMN